MRCLSHSLLFLTVVFTLYQSTIQKECKLKVWRAVVNTAESCGNDEKLAILTNFKMVKDGRYIAIFSGQFNILEDLNNPMLILDVGRETTAGTTMKVIEAESQMCKADGAAAGDGNAGGGEEGNQKEKKMLVDPIPNGSNFTLDCPVRKGYYEAWNVTYNIFDVYEGKIKTGKYIATANIKEGDRVILCLTATVDVRIEHMTFEDCPKEKGE